MWSNRLVPVPSGLYLDYLWEYESTSLSDVFIDEVSRYRMHETLTRANPKEIYL